MPGDEELIRQVAAGGADAFDTLHARHRDAVRARVGRIVRDDACAEDVTQDVFLRVWTRAGQWNGQGTVIAWLSRIAQNAALNHPRSARARSRNMPRRVCGPADGEPLADGDRFIDAGLSPAELAARAEQREELARTVDGLPPAKREVWRLVYEDELDLATAAETLGIPTGTVKSRLYHARRLVAEAMQAMEEEGDIP